MPSDLGERFERDLEGGPGEPQFGQERLGGGLEFMSAFLSKGREPGRHLRQIAALRC